MDSRVSSPGSNAALSRPVVSVAIPAHQSFEQIGSRQSRQSRKKGFLEDLSSLRSDPASRWLCGAENTAVYGACVASAFDRLEILGPSDDSPPLHPGLPFAVSVLKLDAYGQIIATDSVSLIQAVTVGPGASVDNATAVTGTVVEQLDAGRANFIIGVRPSYKMVDPLHAVTVLLHQPHLQFVGLDAESLTQVASAPLKLSLASGTAVCPAGYVLQRGSPKPGPARTAECFLCEPGTYSTSPLAGNGDPDCYSCPVSGVCAGGADVQFSVGTWAVVGGVYHLMSCPIGHSLINSATPGGPFDQSLQQCHACDADQYILDSSLANISCETCPVGASCNGSGLTSLVHGAVWTADITAGAYKLQSCPAGYELLNADAYGNFEYSLQQCSLCPPAYFCTGGSAGRVVCSDGTFTKSGANASTACQPAVSVAVTVTLPMPEAHFTSDKQAAFREALADASGVVPDQVLLRQLSQTRRTGDMVAAVGSSVKILCYVEVPDAVEADAVTSALSASRLNAQLERQGLPDGTLNSVAVVQAVSDGGGVSWLLVGLLLGAAVLVLLIAAVVAGRMLSEKLESEEDRDLRLAVCALRTLLRIRREDGWFLESERRSVVDSRTMRGFVRRQHAEAAARLALAKDYDLHQFDSFCMCLEEAVLPSSRGSDGRGSSDVQRGGSTTTSSTFGFISFNRGEAPDPYSLLCKWLLEVSAALIRTDHSVRSDLDGGEAHSHGIVSGSGVQFFFVKVAKARIWRDDPTLFGMLQATSARCLAAPFEHPLPLPIAP